MKRRLAQPIALTIAGSDSGGGAGIQADLKTFSALGVFGTTVITCLTAQNPVGVFGVQAATPEIITRQLKAVFSELRPQAVKTGMLLSGPIIEAVTRSWPRTRRPPLVVDPVMVATSGARLLKPAAVRGLVKSLLPLATLVTPNLDETVILVGRSLSTFGDLRDAAREIHSRFGCAALVKGGHLQKERVARDVFFDGSTELVLEAPFIRHVSTHGTGCTYSAAIVGFLALGMDLIQAVEMAKRHITQAIAQSVRVGSHTALNPFWAEGGIAGRRRPVRPESHRP